MGESGKTMLLRFEWEEFGGRGGVILQPGETSAKYIKNKRGSVGILVPQQKP